MPSFSIKVGDRFTRLTVIEVVTTGRLRCKCDCGKVVVVYRNALLVGHDKSCGCMHKEVLVQAGYGKRTHGHSLKPSGKQKLTPEYVAWRAMRRRCSKPSDKSFKNYGARGIKVCGRWFNSFENFYADMGPKPSPQHTIERKNTNGNYEPSNCVWDTRLRQGRNKTNNVFVTVNGDTRCLAEWSQLTGIKAGTLQRRVKYNWPVDLLFIPPKLGRRIHAVR